MKNFVRLSLLRKVLYVGGGAEVSVNGGRVEFLSPTGEFVFCDGIKLYGAGYYDDTKKELHSANMVADKGCMVEQFISENDDLDSNIISFLRAYPETLDIVGGDDGFSFDVTPEKWIMASTLMKSEPENCSFMIAAAIGTEIAERFNDYIK